MKKLTILILIGIIHASASMYAQQQGKRITGTVVDDMGEQIIGANVIEKGTVNGVITDLEGRFSLTVQENATLQISYIGFVTQEIPVRNQTAFAITLREDAQRLDEVVVTGYSVEKKRDLTGAVSVVKLDEIESIVSGSVMQTLQGRVPGLFITGNGSPTSSASVLIRGTSTLSGNSPLYIIDGMPGNMNSLSAYDIESIQVLKDASAASIYGSRASGGVIVVTTKKADRQTSSVSFRSSLNVKTYTEKPLNWMNTYERGWAQWRAYRNDGNAIATSWPYTFVDHQEADGTWILDNITWPEWIDGDKAVPTMRSSDTDWVKEIMQTSVTQTYNVTVSTGGTRGRALFSMDYLDNVGQVKGTYSNRMTLRLNSDYSVINNRLTIGENIQISKTKNGAVSASSLLTRTQQIQPIIPIHTVDGIGWGGNYGAMDDNGQNPLREIEWDKDNYSTSVRLQGNIFADLEIIKNLHFKTTFGLQHTFSFNRNMTLPYADGASISTLSRVSQSFDNGGTFTWNNTLTYILSQGDHSINLLIGHEQSDTNSFNQSYQRDGYDIYDPDYMYVFAGESAVVPSGSASQSRLLSFFGKANYVFKDRYLASITLRRDGSSKFGKNNRYGTFPAFSIGWRLSQESFFHNLSPVISDLKFRFSWGQTGNQSGIGDFAAQGLYRSSYQSSWINVGNFDSSTAYDITGQGTGTRPMGFRRTQMPNPALKWETSTQMNPGIDFGLFEQKLTGQVEYFFNETTDILVTPPTLGVLGEGASQTVNGATMENKGVEFLLTYRDRKGPLRYSISANLSHSRNKVTLLPDEVISQYAGNGQDKTIIGRQRSVVYGYYTDGLFKSQEAVDGHVTQTGKGIGRLKYLDIAGPAKQDPVTGQWTTSDPDGQITVADRDFIGKTDPDFIYGFQIALQYKQWDLNMFWNGVQGSYANVGGVKRNNQFIGAAGHTGQNYGKQALDAWSYENPNSDIPRLSMRDLNLEGSTRGTCTYFLENTSYFKLRNIEIGYTVPKATANKALMQNARVFLLGENLLKFYKKSGKQAFTQADPETPGTAYPLPLSFTAGLQVSF